MIQAPPITPEAADLRDPSTQAFWLLRAAFVVAPIVFGLDKFLNLLTDWPSYLAPFAGTGSFRT